MTHDPMCPVAPGRMFVGVLVCECDPIWGLSRLTRIEPPVGWPVGVPTEDGGTLWYVRDSPFGNYKPTTPERDNREWADLLAAGGVAAQAVTR